MKRVIVFTLSFLLAFAGMIPEYHVHAEGIKVSVNDSQVDKNEEHYFTYSEAKDINGANGWSNSPVNGTQGDDFASSQHWVWNQNYDEAKKHTYSFTFKGTGVDIYGIKNDSKNIFRLNDGAEEIVTIKETGKTPGIIYSVSGLDYGIHTVYVSMADSGTGLQVSYADVYMPSNGNLEITEIPHTQTSDVNGFKFSSQGWSAMGQSDEHVWSDPITEDLKGQVYYEVNFMGSKIDIYAGKNRPMGKVKYTIDGKDVGVFSLYNSSNINSTLITTVEGLEEGVVHTLRAEATGEKDTNSTNNLIDASKVVVYHEPYKANSITLSQAHVNLIEEAKYQIAYTVDPTYVVIKDMKFISDNQDVATVDKNGLITAHQPGTAKVEVTSASHNFSEIMTVKVEKSIAQMTGTITSNDIQNTTNQYDVLKDQGLVNESLTAWKNDKVTSQVVVLSKDSRLENVQVSIGDLTNDDNTISNSNFKSIFIKPNIAYNGPFLGYGNPNRPYPEDDGSNRSEVSDILYQEGGAVNIGFNSLSAVWLEFNIPTDAKAGIYTTEVVVSANDIDDPLVFNYTVEVKDTSLANVEDFKDTFDFELWQYPYSSAEYYDVEPFSEEHFKYLTPIMEKYIEVGGNAITASIIEDAWNGQTFGRNDVKYPSMVKWNKQANGEFTYDYTDFDKWVKFNKDLGIADKIIIYSIAPWNNSFTYYENGTLVKQAFNINNEKDQEIWRTFLQDFVNHLMDNGWFESSYIGIDERGFSHAAFDVVESVKNIHGNHLKTAGAMDNIGGEDRMKLAMRVTDLTIGDTAAQHHYDYYVELLEMRREKGFKTTLYSCTEHHPGQFSLSHPVESYWAIINAGKYDADGFLRWAYDAWVEEPLEDTTHNAFESGDTFVIYPGDKGSYDARSSIRLERMAEGIRDVNKVYQIVDEIPALQSDADKLFASIEYRLYTGHNFLKDSEIQQLVKETAEFKKGLNVLTDKYIYLGENGTDRAESLEILGGEEINVQIGESVSLEYEIKPENLIDKTVIWSSDNPTVATINSNGTVVGHFEGEATITATSKVNSAIKDSIKVVVTGVEIDEASVESYYDFEDITDGIIDLNGKRDGQNFGGTSAPGKFGNAIEFKDVNNHVKFDGTSAVTKNWTVGYWVQNTNANAEQISVLRSNEGGFALSLRLSETRPQPGFRVGNGAGDVLTFNTNIPVGSWSHITWTLDETKGISMYVNGLLIGTNNWTVGKDVKNPLDILGGMGLTGLVDELKLYNRVLSNEEIIASMQVPGFNLTEDSKSLVIGETYQIHANLHTNLDDKKVSFSSDNPSVATVDETGLVTTHSRGLALITLEHKASGQRTQVKLSVSKKLNIKNVLPEYDLDEKFLSTIDIDKGNHNGRQYLGQPDLVRTSEGTLISAYPVGHGKGPIVMKLSHDDGETWTELQDTPKSWVGSQETPTLYVLNLEDGTERIMMITALPGWGTDSAGFTTGWNTSYSDDGGYTWTEYKHWFPNHDNGKVNKAIVGMASLVQLKDENGDFIQKWMGVYHDYDFVNYKTYLTFDEEGNEQWTAPETYLSEYRSIESSYQMCEVGMFRSPDGSRIVGLVRSQSHKNLSLMIYSDDEGQTWSEPEELNGSLLGERHKAIYDPVSDRLIITFREIILDYNNNGVIENNDWMAGDWVAWVGTYEDLMEQNDGEYRIRIAEDFTNSAKSGDTGYAGIVALEDGTIITHSYGHFDKEFSESWPGGPTTDLSYIQQAKFKLGDVEYMNNLIDRTEIKKELETYKDYDLSKFTQESVAKFKTAYDQLLALNADLSASQIQLDRALEALKTAFNNLVLQDNIPVEPETPVEPEKPVDPDNGGSDTDKPVSPNQPDGEETENLPATGVSSSLSIGYGFAFAVLGLLLFRKKRSDFN